MKNPIIGLALLALLLSLALPASGFATGGRVAERSGTTMLLTDACPNDPTDAWALGYAGNLLATTEGGDSTVVGTSPDYPPYESLNRNGAIVGFDIDLVKAIGARAGFAVELASDSFGELLIPGLQDPAKYDMVASALTPTAERAAYVDFSNTYIDKPPYGPVAFAFPTGSALRGVVNTALQQVKDDGTLAKLFKRWFKPKIVRLKPSAAARAKTVIIIGSEFGAKRGKSYVKFGAKRCTKYVSWSDAKIKCRVPARAAFGRLKVRVTTTVGTSNAKAFRVKR